MANLSTIIIWGMLITRLVVASLGEKHHWGKGHETKEEFPVSLEKQHEIFKNANKTPNNIEYIGCGYDMYNGSGIDDETGFSLKNYRAPVLDNYSVEMNNEDTWNGGLGIWITNEFLCDLSHELTSVNTQQDLKSLVVSHFKHETSGVFSSSSKEVNSTKDILNKLQRSRTVLVRRFRCTVYNAGLLFSNMRVNTKKFNSIVQRLVEICRDGFKEENCPIKKYENNMDDEGCEGCIASWMRFFADFGTHVTERISMGGVFRRFSNIMDKEASRDSSKEEATKTSSSSWFGLSRSSSQNINRSQSNISRGGKEDDVVQYAVGPEPHDESMSPEVFEDWVHKVGYNPVPIDVEFTSLYYMMPDNNAMNLYKEALKYYAKLKGVEYSDVETKSFRSPLLHLLKESEIIAINGRHKVIKDVCSGNSKIIFGFGVNLNDKKQILEVKSCYPGLNACILDFNLDVRSTFVMAMCGELQNYDVVQKITKGVSQEENYNEVKCPSGTVVGFGVIIQFTNPIVMISCPIGAASCGHLKLGPQGFIWVTCFPKETFGLNLYSTKAEVVESGGKLECGHGVKVANGFTIYSAKSDNDVKVEACHHLKRTNKEGRIPAMEYLGCGYDILYGNPLADNDSLVDPGYRDPIISFTLVQHQGKSRKGLKYANIPGAWIRPLVSCKRSTENTIVQSMDDYKKALAVDSEIGLGTVDESVKFALSAGYAESSGLHLSKKRRMHIQRNYCFLLEAALPVNGNYAFKKSFKLALSQLTPNFRKSAESCTTIRYAMNPDHPDCVGCVKPWMKLFEWFGTHFTYNIKIGGRLTEISQVNMEQNERKSTSDVKVGADARVRKGIFDASVGVNSSNASNRANVSNISLRYVNVLGGRPIGNTDDEDEYLGWIHSIPENPMPIRSQLAPLSKLFKSKRLQEAYDDAMEFYVELNGLKTSKKDDDTT
ncbi:uncharacterized protein BXIN_0687 [Babesia sp. Xinjiang]|uniref:uncharacterized protein n=1 Tax=Babesia sp. Xinjiang TaxID=462227 RepID=UPI000A2448F8|nr:uncharacterized protein BXIN_0712 [Babesia sp. Xinjiang]XP_028872600.1 uncharacterized protein BXIN_0687 [Babesia sp. Xinjiang]ORM42107.1 hypothetical protein BXIN_0712 [Babesia sp. Xinjiang]ORM42144.1 hypothetical protein BXIN_0687 [Babesia sp. Xinjiang]